MFWMYPYKWKIAALIISAILAFLLIIERIKSFIIIKQFDSNQHILLLHFLLLFSLFGMIFCRERNENDKVVLVRNRAIQIGFTLMIATLLGVTVSDKLFSAHGAAPGTTDILFSIAFGILSVLTLFHIKVRAANVDNISSKSINNRIKHWMTVAYFPIIAIILFYSIFSTK